MEHKIFKSGETAHTIWGPVTLKADGITCLYFDVPNTVTGFIIDKFGIGLGGVQLVFPHPVRVTPIPEFEEREEIEVNNFEDFREMHTHKGKFIGKSSDGRYVTESKFGHNHEIEVFYYARKITKLEKTIEVRKDELVEKLNEKILHLEQHLNSEATQNAIIINGLKEQILSIREQLKQAK